MTMKMMMAFVAEVEETMTAITLTADRRIFK